jgi:hypothetical protein
MKSRKRHGYSKFNCEGLWERQQQEQKALPLQLLLLTKAFALGVSVPFSAFHPRNPRPTLLLLPLQLQVCGLLRFLDSPRTAPHNSHSAD